MIAAAGTRGGNTLSASAGRGRDTGRGNIRLPDLRGRIRIVALMEAPEQPLTEGQTLEVELKMVKTHVFDKETSQTIV